MSEQVKIDLTFYTVWLDENKNFHKLDGPALEQKDGHKEWWLHGSRHRIDGPAVEYTNGNREWWIYGKFYHCKELWFNSLSEDEQTSYLFKLGEK